MVIITIEEKQNMWSHGKLIVLFRGGSKARKDRHRKRTSDENREDDDDRFLF